MMAVQARVNLKPEIEPELESGIDFELECEVGMGETVTVYAS